MEKYDIEREQIADCEIREEMRAFGIERARIVDAGDERGFAARLYALPCEHGEEELVISTNGSPIWREACGAEEWTEALGFYGLSE